MAININNTHHLGPNHADGAKTPLSKSIERLSSGNRINSAADDAARLAIVKRFAAQIEGSNQAYRNVNDGISLAQTGEAAAGEISSQVQRIRELAVQSANGSLSDSDRASLQQEVNGLQAEISRIANSAEFNGVALLNGKTDLDFQTGANAGDRIRVSTQDLAGDLASAGIDHVDISTQDSAAAALAVADSALNLVAGARSEFGAVQSRFESASKNLENVAANLAKTSSRIEDTDFATEVSNFIHNRIRQDANTAIAGQANAMAQQVLTLLN